MISQCLRQVSREQLMWSQSALRWQQLGATLVRTLPSPDSALLAIRADSGWEGLLDLDVWFASMMPAHAGLANTAFSRAQRERLFFSCERPLELGLTVFDYCSLSPAEKPDLKKIRQPHYGLQTQQGTLWLTAIGDKNKYPSLSRRRMSLDSLPMPLHFELGSSECRLSLVKKFCSGDVLLIVEQGQYVTLHGKRLGFYQRTGDEIMMEEDFLKESWSDESTDLTAEVEQGDERVSISPRSQMPVKLTFTLQQVILTVQDLEALSQGHVFFCDPEAEKKVIVSGNGLPLAQGELIWIDDRLGVEITRLYHEAGNGE